MKHINVIAQWQCRFLALAVDSDDDEEVAGTAKEYEQDTDDETLSISEFDNISSPDSSGSVSSTDCD